MNITLLNALKQIVSQYGVETLADARLVKALLADLAGGEPRPQKTALVACVEQGFATPLQNIPPAERGAAKAKMAERLNREEGLDTALCADTLDLLEAALFGAGMLEQVKTLCQKCGKKLQADWIVCPYCGAAAAHGATPQTRPVSQNTPPQPPVPASPAFRDREVWRELRTLRGHTGWVLSVAYSPDGRSIASGSYDNTLKIWDAETGRELRDRKSTRLNSSHS
jgi:hypothetical protein